MKNGESATRLINPERFLNGSLSIRVFGVSIDDEERRISILLFLLISDPASFSPRMYIESISFTYRRPPEKVLWPRSFFRALREEKEILGRSRKETICISNSHFPEDFFSSVGIFQSDIYHFYKFETWFHGPRLLGFFGPIINMAMRMGKLSPPPPFCQDVENCPHTYTLLALRGVCSGRKIAIKPQKKGLTFLLLFAYTYAPAPAHNGNGLRR